MKSNISDFEVFLKLFDLIFKSPNKLIDQAEKIDEIDGTDQIDERDYRMGTN
ncbi:MAG: hypothetical protein ABSH06_00620 [Thermodesulfobacteriota bacterium]|jgi:hypothetical protein